MSLDDILNEVYEGGRRWHDVESDGSFVKHAKYLLRNAIQDTVRRRQREARIDELTALHQNIMENPKWLSDEPDQAFAYTRVHRIIDERIQVLSKPVEPTKKRDVDL